MGRKKLPTPASGPPVRHAGGRRIPPAQRFPGRLSRGYERSLKSMRQRAVKKRGCSPAAFFLQSARPGIPVRHGGALSSGTMDGLGSMGNHPRQCPVCIPADKAGNCPGRASAPGDPHPRRRHGKRPSGHGIRLRMGHNFPGSCRLSGPVGTVLPAFCLENGSTGRVGTEQWMLYALSNTGCPGAFSSCCRDAVLRRLMRHHADHFIAG